MRNKTSKRRVEVVLLLVVVGCTPVVPAYVESADAVFAAGGTRADAVLGSLPELRGAAGAPLDGDALFEAGVSGQLTLSVLVSCALDLGAELDVSVPIGGSVQFPGEFGIAPRWLDEPVDRDRREVLTGCVLARLSVDGLFSLVSIRAPRLRAGEEERALAGVEEGAFFGDLFDGGQVLAACRGRGLLEDPTDVGLAERHCAEPDPARPGLTLCGLRFAGDCRDVCDRSGHRYSRCRVDGRGYRPVTAAVP